MANTRGSFMVIQKYTAVAKGSRSQRFEFSHGQYQNFRLHASRGLCIETHYSRLTQNNHALLWNCRNSGGERWSIKYFNAGANQGFTPYKLFTVTSKMSGGRALYVSDDGSLLQQDERYVKLRSPKGTDDEKFFYDPKDKLVHPFLFKNMHLSKQSQGDVYILTVKDNTAHFDTPTLDSWFAELDQIVGGTNCKSGSCGGLAIGALDEVNDNDVYLGLEPNSHKTATRWNIRYSSATSSSRPSMRPRSVSNEKGGYGFNAGKRFSIRSRHSGRRVLYVDGSSIKVRSAKNNNQEIFTFENGLIKAATGRYLSAQLNSKGDGFRLVTTSKKGDVNEYFTRAGKNIALMTNKQAVIDIPKNQNGASVTLSQNKSGDRQGFDIIYK